MSVRLITIVSLPILTLLASSALADQKATISCSNSNVELIERSPYWGENSKYTQSLFVLKRKGSDESVDTAYFLDVDLESDVDAQSMIWTVGKNNKGGQFALRTQAWKDVGNGTVIKNEAVGLLTYSHGPLQGVDEAVVCTKN